MDARHEQLLERAEAAFRHCRIRTAFPLYRRVFDQLPFGFRPGLSQPWGNYVRCLVEMGRARDLEFYRRFLERHFRTCPSPELTYCLALCHVGNDGLLSSPGLELMGQVLTSAEPGEVRARAKMILANHALWRDDMGAAFRLVESMDADSVGEVMWGFVEVWKGVVMTLREQWKPALDQARKIEARLSRQHWYLDCWVMHLKARAFAGLGERDKARRIVDELARMKEKQQLYETGQMVERMKKHTPSPPRPLRWEAQGGILSLGEGEPSLRLMLHHPVARLFLSFAEKKTLSKDQVMRAYYGKPYEGREDNDGVYHGVRSLRKQLTRLGYPPNSVSFRKDHRYELDLSLSQRRDRGEPPRRESWHKSPGP